MKKKVLGFTLIELLVVIAIIGILAAVVLASLNDARDEGVNSSIQQSVGQVRSQAELVYTASTTLSYSEVCNDATIQTLMNEAATLGADVDDVATYEIDGAIATAGSWDTAICHSDATSWVAAAPLKESDAVTSVLWCIDSTGFVGEDDAVDATALTCN